MPKRMPLFAVLASALVVVWSAAAQAQSYPAKPIKLILPYSPGGIIDYVGRSWRSTWATDRAAGGRREPPGRRRHRRHRHGRALGAGRLHPRAHGSGDRDQSDAAAEHALRPVQAARDRLDRQLLAGGGGGRAAAAGEDHRRARSPTARPIPASSTSRPPASARRRISPASCSSSAPASMATHVPYRSIGASYPDMMANKMQFAFSSIAGALPFTTDNRVRPIATTGAQAQRRSIPTCRPSTRPA